MMTYPQMKKFIAAIGRGWSTSRACRVAGIADNVPELERKKNPEFADMWRRAYEIGTDLLEDTAMGIAMHGTKKPVWYQGFLVGWEHKVYPNLQVKMLEARRPEKYKRFSAGEDTPQIPGGEDVLAVIEQRLAGIASRQSVLAGPAGDPEGTDEGPTIPA